MPEHLTAEWMIAILVIYFLLLIGMGWWTSRGEDGTSNHTFFSAGKRSPWYLVAFGMIGSSISGVTFISVPGWVEARQFSYLQMVFGYLLGYAVIALVLMPLYYRLGLVSIYTYLRDRFGATSYRTGALAFLISRTVGTALRLFLMSLVLHKFVLAAFGIPFPLTVAVTIFLIWTYTFRGGIKTIVYTDALQTICLLVALALSIVFMCDSLGWSGTDAISNVLANKNSQVLFFEGGWGDSRNFFKQVLGGLSICVVMSGLDQDIMQKNLTCAKIGDAQKNMFWFSNVLVIANMLFVFLGALLYAYASQSGMELPMEDGKFRSDYLFPAIAFQYQPFIVGVLFLLGITASTYASSDSALASLTTVACIDFLNIEAREKRGENTKKLRTLVHFGFSALLCFLCISMYYLDDKAVIQTLFKVASITYGPLLGLFAFGLLTRRSIIDRWAWIPCVLGPLLAFMVDKYSIQLLNGYKFDNELLLLNGLLVFIGLWAISKPKTVKTPALQS